MNFKRLYVFLIIAIVIALFVNTASSFEKELKVHVTMDLVLKFQEIHIKCAYGYPM